MIGVRLASIGLLSALLGCAHAPRQPPPAQLYWRKAGATQDDYNVQAATCRMKLAAIPDAPITPDNGGLGNALVQASDIMANTASRQQFMSDCMVVGGWRLSR